MKLRLFAIFYLCTIFYNGLAFEEKSHSQKIKALATTTFIADIAKNIAGENIEIVCLMPVGGDPHIYDPTPGDAQKVVESDIVLKNGLSLEGWLDELINNAGGERPVVTITEGIIPIKSEQFHGSPDPHAWMDPVNGIIYAQNIKNAFINMDAKNASQYEANFLSYKKQLLELSDFIVSQIDKISHNQRVLITSHDAFHYFGNRYKIRVEAAMGTSTDAEVQIKDMNRLIDVINNTGVKSVFIESTINPKLMQQLATDRNIVIGGKLFADSLGDDLSGADTYINMLKLDVNTIVAGLLQDTRQDNEAVSLLPLFITVIILFIISFLIVLNKIKTSHDDKLNWNNYQVIVKGLSVSYHRKTVLSNISLTLDSGKLYGLIGPNGAGKSTLIKAALGLVPVNNGSVLINNTNVGKIRRHLAYIPQKEQIDWEFPATVNDIVLMGRLPHKKKLEGMNAKDYSIALDAIKTVGMEEFIDRQIGNLSGGQQQRVFIARALCQQANVLFFDEPFVGVDILTEEKIIEIIRKLALQGNTVVVIHHDLAKVKEYFDNVIMINQRLIAFGKISEVMNDENIHKTYGGRLTLLQKTDTFIH